MKKLRRVSRSDSDVFLIMPFGAAHGGRAYYDRLADVVRGYFEGLGMKVVRADESRLDDSLWHSITRHMRASESGVAVIDAAARCLPSPNVFIEIGYMLSFRKPLMILHETSGRDLPLDLRWMICGQYTHDNIDEDIPRALDAWLEQRNVIPPAVATIRERIRLGSLWPNPLEPVGRHVIVVNFGKADEAFDRYVSYICQFFRSRRRGTYLQVVLKPRRPKLLVELLLRDQLRQRHESFELPDWLRMHNAVHRHLPTRLRSSDFARQWFCKVAAQLPDRARCVIVCENTSRYLKDMENRDEFVKFEARMAHFLTKYIPGRTVGVVCTYDWADIRAIARGPRSRNVARIRRILDSHDEVLVITSTGRCLTGKAAVSYVRRAMARLGSQRRAA